MTATKQTPRARWQAVAAKDRAWLLQFLRREEALYQPSGPCRVVIRAAIAMLREAAKPEPESAADMARRLGFKPHGRPPQ